MNPCDYLSEVRTLAKQAGEKILAIYNTEFSVKEKDDRSPLTAADMADQDYFGASVALEGDYAIVGAGGNDDDGIDSGSAYIFKREGEDWIEQGKLTARERLDEQLVERFDTSLPRAEAGEAAALGREQAGVQQVAAEVAAGDDPGGPISMAPCVVPCSIPLIRKWRLFLWIR